MNSKQTLESLGLKVIEKASYDFSATSGKKCYGQLLENPDFTDLKGFEEAAKRAPLAKFLEPKMDGVDFGGRRFIVTGGKFVADVSPRYTLIQHGEILMNAREAAKSIGLKPVGQLRFDGGRMHGHMLFVGAEQQVQILKDTGEDIAVGARFTNSIDGSRSISVESFGVRTICCNYNLWGYDIAGMTTTHADSTAPEQMEKAFRLMIEQSRKLPSVINKAKEEMVRVEDVPLLLHGIRFPQAYVSRKKDRNLGTLEGLRAWEPSIKANAKEVSRWEVYNATTALLTHGMDIKADAVEHHAKLSVPLLVRSMDSLMALGRERLQEITQREQDNLAKKSAKVAASPQKDAKPTQKAPKGSVRPAAPKPDAASLLAKAKGLKAQQMEKAKAQNKA